jgi:hypothetical protein
MREKEERRKTKIELLLDGCAVLVEDMEEAQDLLDSVTGVLGLNVTGKEIIDSATKYAENAVIKAIDLSTLDDMLLICLPMETDEDEGKFNLLDRYGVFSYVYNATEPMFSELGYSCFECTGGILSRVG